MIKETVEYVDYNGTTRKEDFWFNLNEAELTEAALSVDGGLDVKIRKIIDTKNQAEMIKLFKEILLMSYGEKSDDGRYFIKSKEKSTAFSQTEAYNILFMNFARDDDAAAKFINGILPNKK